MFYWGNGGSIMKKILAILLTAVLSFASAGNFVYAEPFCYDEDTLADALHEFGLFQGTGTDSAGNPIYSLEKAPTRQEALVMLVRLLGKEEAAANGTWKHPFTDVDSWADKYVGYAYENGIAKGTTETLFGAKQNISAQQYITFLLRALGYSDASGGDFIYSNACAFSDSVGLTNGVYSLNSSFLRGDIVWLSCSALLQKQKSNGVPLVKQLKNDGAITESQYINGLKMMEIADLKEDFRYITLYQSDGNDVVIDVFDLYSQPGTGEYSGYQQIKGYDYDDVYPIYYKGSKGSYSYTVDHNDNLDEICYWNFNGVTYKNTRRECYGFFSDTLVFQSYYGSLSNEVLSSNWFRAAFGDTYEDWVHYMAFTTGNADRIVERFLDVQSGTYYNEPHGGLSPESYFGLYNAQEAYSEQLINADWISENELRNLSGNSDLCFDSTISSLDNYYNGTGNIVYGFYIQGIASQELMFIYDMPDSFAKSENAEGKYSGINFKRENNEWYFNPADLISVGLLNSDGSFNENFIPQTFMPEKAEKEWESEWITSQQLDSIYGLSSYFAGGEVWIWHDALYGEDGKDVKYVLTGVPKSSLGKDVVHNSKYNGHTIRLKYDGGFDGGLAFNYQDLVDAGIIDD